MAIVYEQFPSVLIKGYFNLGTSSSVFYYDKNIGYKPSVLTRSVLSRQASFFLFYLQDQSSSIAGTTINMMHILNTE